MQRSALSFWQFETLLLYLVNCISAAWGKQGRKEGLIGAIISWNFENQRRKVEQQK